ncbi:hypothetical protein V5O48_004147 [Marasmius crinis-equi]|uniref:BTB domain-containing protein n=1 Tax=Marasmius crinis-equi TaxID=585013 RepID=A0ABR3FR62_9AGAR
MDSSVPKLERHPKYTFEDASVSIIVENRMRFDVHRYLLRRDSKFFERLITGTGAFHVLELKIREFESLLDFLYDGMYRISPVDTPVESWIDLLAVSTTLEFPRARGHAIAAIDLCQSSNGTNTTGPARMIQIAKLYAVEKWLEPARVALTEREEMISDEEAEMVGMRDLLKIVKAREARLTETIRRLSNSGVGEDSLDTVRSDVEAGPTSEPVVNERFLTTPCTLPLSCLRAPSPTFPPVMPPRTPSPSILGVKHSAVPSLSNSPPMALPEDAGGGLTPPSKPPSPAPFAPVETTHHEVPVGESFIPTYSPSPWLFSVATPSAPTPDPLSRPASPPEQDVESPNKPSSLSPVGDWPLCDPLEKVERLTRDSLSEDDAISTSTSASYQSRVIYNQEGGVRVPTSIVENQAICTAASEDGGE